MAALSPEDVGPVAAVADTFEQFVEVVVAQGMAGLGTTSPSAYMFDRCSFTVGTVFHASVFSF